MNPEQSDRARTMEPLLYRSAITEHCNAYRERSEREKADTEGLFREEKQRLLTISDLAW